MARDVRRGAVMEGHEYLPRNLHNFSAKKKVVN
jgi:hypothetical protein